MGDRISILCIRFDNELRMNEIPMFRGAVVAALRTDNVLFHNHSDNGLRYAYPLIQYKRINGKAAIVCIGGGTESIGEFFSNMNKPLLLGNREIVLSLNSVKADKILVQVWNATDSGQGCFDYTLRKWLPLNSDNYAEYQSIDGLKERYAMLEKIIVGNILSFAKGLNITLDKQITCSITEIEEKSPLRYKGVKFAAFDVCFKSNVSLPNFIGLGKGVSHGFGMIVKHT